MASAVTVLSREETNFLRVANLLIRLSPKAVRILFDREFNPSGLKSIFSKNWTKLDKLKKKRVITQTQWSLLFPSSSDPKSNDFDLTLMVCLLRNLTKVTIQDQLPQPSDMSEGAAVSRIKFYRNQISHSDSGAMSDADSITIFATVSKAIEIICPNMKSDCTSLQNADLDYSFHEIYVEFVKKEKHLEEIAAQVETLNLERNNIQSIQTEEISEWKKKLEKFYVTEAATRLIKVVEDNQCTIIIGIPGSGKTALAYHVAIHMQETEGYTVLPIWLPSEMIKMTNPNIKQLFVFDDVFGKYSLNEFNLNCWESETRRIKMLLKNKILKVIITCRSYLYDNVRDSLSSQSFEQFNLQSDDINLSLAERKEISKLYLTDDVVSQLNDEIIMMYSFFPLLCVMFKENLMENVDFFQNPNQFIKNEIENFKSRQDVSFLALALLVLSNNSIEKEGLQIGKDKYDSMLQDLFDEMDTRKTPSKTSILSNLHNLKNMYLAEKDSIVCTKHDKIFDIISHTLGNFIIRSILRHGESAFISSRCQLISINEQHGDYTIMITHELETMYFERIFKDIENGHNWEVFASIQMQFENYRNLLMQYLEKKSPKFSSSINDFTTSLHVTAAKGYYDISKFLLEKNRKHISSLDDNNRSPLHQAAMNGHYRITQLFLSAGAEINQRDYDGYTPLLHSCDNGYPIVTKELIKNHASVHIGGKDSWYPLHIAACVGNDDLIKLLVKHKAKVNKRMNDGKTPLYIACHCGHFNAVKLLIKSKADVNKCENEGFSPLAVACFKEFNDIAEILIFNGSDVNKNTNTGQIPLHFACEKNLIDLVKLLLKHGSAINKGDVNENTSLHIACREDNVEIVKLLCESGASTNKRSISGYTPLHCFCHQDCKNIIEQPIIKEAAVNKVDDTGDELLIQKKDSNKDLIKYLIKLGADVNSVINNGMTPISLACECDNLEAAKSLLNHKADANKCDNNGFSPLHFASMNGNEDIVNILLEHGVSIDQCNEVGETPLHCACIEGNKNIAEILINEGAAVNKVNYHGNTALLSACNNMHNEIALVLLENGTDVNDHDQNGRTSLHSAAEDGNTNLIKILIEHNANINFQLINGMTPIYIACRENHLEAVKLLLSYKADINICEETGWNPLLVASSANNKEVVEYLCDHSAAVVNLSNKHGSTPLHLACLEGNEVIVKLLLKHDASINHCDESGLTSFHKACSKGNANIVELLLKENAAVNVTDGTDRTSLYIACQGTYAGVVELLLKHGSEVNNAAKVESEEGWTPLHVSASSGDTRITELLLHNNATVNVEDRNGHTPLYYATKQKHDDIIELLVGHGAISSNSDVQIPSLSTEQKRRKRCVIQ